MAHLPNTLPVASNILPLHVFPCLVVH